MFLIGGTGSEQGAFLRRSKPCTGRCACDAIRFEIAAAQDVVALCRCNDCKKASGGEAAVFFAVRECDFAIVAGTPKGFGYNANSGKKLEGMFRPDRGARLYTRGLESFPALVFVTIGSRDSPTSFEPTLEMFAKRRPDRAKPLDMAQFADMPS